MDKIRTIVEKVHNFMKCGRLHRVVKLITK